MCSQVAVDSMSKWLSLFRVVVIKPLPNKVVEEVLAEAEGPLMEQEEEEEEVSIPKAPTTQYNKKKADPST